ncbi:putative mitochondrial protein AtMg00310 [Castanea sativa]|uniref:putative mitochondrial protein AtMg00310 n=1 Tax=Castanea sativa TaxID=21020 RepID=UPI003F652F8D
MGFKEIEKFNEALLAKQVWRMMHNLESLCYKVFKTRFFPNCSIQEAKESTVRLYTWKSILSARDVVKKGMVWRVGNGQSVCIREDKWLPDQVCKTVLIPPPSLPPDAKVCTLIDPESAT